MSFLPSLEATSIPYNRLFTTLTSRLSGAGKQAIELEISNAMQEFCRETNVWRERIAQNLIADQEVYHLVPDAHCAEVTYIMSLMTENRPRRPLSADSTRPKNAWGTYEVLVPYSTIALLPPSQKDVPKGLEAVIALAPGQGNLNMPPEIINQHFEAIIDGTLERMFAHRNRPYYDSDSAAYHHRRFRAAITRVRRIVRGGNAKADPAWRFNNQAPGKLFRGGRSYGW